MTDLVLIVIYSLLSGSTIFLGGILSHYFGDYMQAGHVKAEIIHISIGFGGGILMAAVGLVLVPEGMKVLPLALILLCICLWCCIYSWGNTPFFRNALFATR